MSLSSGTMSVGVLAIFSGLLGAYGLRAILLSEPPARAQGDPYVTVPLATADLPAGRIIRFGDVGINRLTQKQVVERKLANPSVMLSADQIIGRRTRSAIRQGEAFLTTSMHLEGGWPNVSEVLKPGLRAVQLQIPDLLGGNLDPGTYVDVVFRATQAKSFDGSAVIPSTTVTLFQGVEVLSADHPKPVVSGQDSNALDIRTRRFGSGPSVITPPSVVTLAVTLDQAAVLRTVEGRGEICLIPRSMQDGLSDGRISADVPAFNRLTLEDLLGIQGPPPPFATEIYRAGSREVKSFGGDVLARAMSYADKKAADSSSDSGGTRAGKSGPATAALNPAQRTP